MIAHSMLIEPAADGVLKEHERTLFGAFLSLLADDADAADLATLLLRTDPAGRATVLASTGLAALEPTEAMIHFGNETMRWVHEYPRPLVLDNGVGVLGPMQEALERAGMRSAAVFPLSHLGRPVGALVLGRKTGPSPFVFVDLTLVTLFGHLLSTIFERLRLFEWMQAQDENGDRQPGDWLRAAAPVPLPRGSRSPFSDQMSGEDASPPRRAGSVPQRVRRIDIMYGSPCY